MKTNEWPSQWTKCTLITISKTAKSRTCSDPRMISLISHASKVLFRIIQERISLQIKKIFVVTVKLDLEKAEVK